MRRPNGVPAAMGAATTTQEQAPPAELLERVVEATARERYSLEEVRYMAKAAEQSKMYGMTESQAFVLMMIAEAKGLHPIEAMQRYHIIHNRPSMRAEAMLAEMQARGWDVDWISDDDDPDEQVAMWSHPRRKKEPKRIGFTREQAEQAELKSDLWKKYPSNMLRARAISNAVRKLDPGVLLGMYTPEEIADMSAPKPSHRHFEPPEIEAADPGLAPPPPPAPPRRRDESPSMESPTFPDDSPAQPGRGECSAWIQSRVDETENEWAMLCAKEKKPYEKLGLNPWRVINGVITDWVAKELIDPQSVLTDGKRDKSKVMDMIRREWTVDDDGEGLKQDVIAYLRDKLETAAKAAGINLDAEPQEVAADA